MQLLPRVRVEEPAVRGMRHLALSLIVVRDPAQQKREMLILLGLRPVLVRLPRPRLAVGEARVDAGIQEDQVRRAREGGSDEGRVAPSTTQSAREAQKAVTSACAASGARGTATVSGTHATVSRSSTGTPEGSPTGELTWFYRIPNCQ